MQFGTIPIVSDLICCSTELYLLPCSVDSLMISPKGSKVELEWVGVGHYTSVPRSAAGGVGQYTSVPSSAAGGVGECLRRSNCQTSDQVGLPAE